MRRAMFSVALAFAAGHLSAMVAEANGHSWNYVLKDGGASIVSCVAPLPSGSLEVPLSLGGVYVTEIGLSAFNGCVNLTSVAIPYTVTQIGDGAFSFCKKLVSFSVPVGNPSYSDSYNGSLLTKDGKTLVRGVAVGAVDVPPGVATIGANAFKGCTDLTSVWMPSSMTSIEDSAFYGCTGLTSVTIPSGVTEIGALAFADCSGLATVRLPDSLINLAGSAFWGCGSLKAILVSDDNPYYRSEEGSLLTKDGTMLLRGVAVGAVTVPPGVTRIGGAAFYGCGELTSVEIPSGVTEIEAAAFSGCGGLTKVVIPSSVTAIGEGAFDACDGLEEVHAAVGDAARVRKLYAWGKGCRFYENGVLVPDGGKTDPSGTGAPYETAACVYNGILKEGDRLAGTLEVKVAKMKDGAAKVTATALLGARKVSFKGGVADGAGAVTAMSAGGLTLAITLGADSFAGTLGAYEVDGARDVFAGKSAADRAAAAAALASWQGAVNIVADGAVLSVSIGSKGKSKVAGTVDGVKVSATSKLIVGAAGCVVGVQIAKKAQFACTMLLGADGTVSVEGLPGAIAGKPGDLKAGAAFRCPADALRAVVPGLLADRLPDGLAIAAAGAKWMLPKAGKVVLVKGTEEVDAAKAGQNPAGLKLAYKAKDGSFKGSFKAYALENGKAKAYTVNVSGVLVDGVGYGTALLKKPACSFAVAVE